MTRGIDLRQLWSLAERLAPRLATAVVSLLLAAFVAPSDVGVYALGIVALTLVQAFSDVGLRQSLLLHWRDSRALPFYDRFARHGRYLSFAAMVLLIALIAVTTGAPSRRFAELLPLAAVPVVAMLSLPWMVALQAGGEWRRASTAQGVGALSGLALSVPVLVATRSIVAGSLQLLLAEVVTLVMARASARRLPDAPKEPGLASIAHDCAVTSGYAAMGWGQSQADRLLVGAVAGTGVLGLYSFASQVSRSLAEAAAQGAGAVLRADLGALDPRDSRGIREAADRAIVRASALVAGLTVLSIAGAWVLSLLLDPQWAPALEVVPLMTASGLGTVAAWNMTAVLQARKIVGRAIWVRLVGIALAVPIALSAQTSLVLAAGAVVVRELFVALLLCVACGEARPARGMRVAGLISVGVSVIGCMYIWIG